MNNKLLYEEYASSPFSFHPFQNHLHYLPRNLEHLLLQTFYLLYHLWLKIRKDILHYCYITFNSQNVLFRKSQFFVLCAKICMTIGVFSMTWSWDSEYNRNAVVYLFNCYRSKYHYKQQTFKISDSFCVNRIYRDKSLPELLSLPNMDVIVRY